ncbi:MAG: 3-phosphoshikimate 1-carboxyvinyltransferase, partial [Smithellaceae bacterium]|nr:3-phosphoshikimate 1-carboxyvinyltransferase [Smithellaceae bacterium]
EGLKALGARIVGDGDEIKVTGTGGRIISAGELYLGNNGTALRFLTTVACLGGDRIILSGDERLRERPVGPLLEALSSLGADIESAGGYPPVEIKGRGLRGGKITLADLESSQYVSSLLIGAPYAAGDVELTLSGRGISMPYIEMTLQTMATFGVTVARQEEKRYVIRAGQRYRGREYAIEADASSASYFFLAAALCRGKVRVENLNPESSQGDLGLLDILANLGCRIEKGGSWVAVEGAEMPRGAFVFDMGDMPDMVPTLAVLSAFRAGRTVITNVAHLRLKESDRLGVLRRELTKIGAKVEETLDGLIIEGGSPRGAEIETYNDHRIAMSFAVAGLACPGITITGDECVSKSFPGFWQELAAL